MKTMKTKHIFRIVFITWTAMWLLFLVRGLIRGEARDYRNLFGRTLEEKRAYVTGKEFYEFIQFCRKVIPENSDYTVEAKYDATMDYFRFAYYLYPAQRNLDDPGYIACYKVRYIEQGYELAASLGSDKYILRKEKK